MIPCTNPTSSPSRCICGHVVGSDYWEQFYSYPPKYPFHSNHTELSPSESLFWTLNSFGFFWPPRKVQVFPGYLHLEGVAVQLSTISGDQTTGERPGHRWRKREGRREAQKGEALRTVPQPLPPTTITTGFFCL